MSRTIFRVLVKERPGNEAYNILTFWNAIVVLSVGM